MPHALTSHFQYYLSLRYRFNIKQAKNKEKKFILTFVYKQSIAYIYIYLCARGMRKNI